MARILLSKTGPWLFSVCTLLMAQVAFAQDYCGEESTWRNHGFDKSRCLTVGALSTAAISSGVYSATSNRKARGIEESDTKLLFDSSQAQGTRTNGSNIAQSIGEGDKVTMDYQLNEKANRKFHIKRMDNLATAAEKEAEYQFQQSLTLMRTEFEYEDRVIIHHDHNGKEIRTTERVIVRSYQVPDYIGRANAAILAQAADEEAIAYRARATEAINGGSVPTYDFQKVIEDTPDTQGRAARFMNAHIKGGGSVQRVTHLPASSYREVKKNITAGRWGLAGLIGFGALTTAETLTGWGADQLDEVLKKPSTQPANTSGGFVEDEGWGSR